MKKADRYLSQHPDPLVRESWASLRKPRSRPTPRHPAVGEGKARKATKVKGARETTSEIRQRAIARAAGFGELCGEPFAAHERPEMAHLCGGSGKRKPEERIETVLMEHHSCHQGPNGLDKAPVRWIPNVKRWAARHGYPVPRRFLKLEALEPVRAAERARRTA